MCTFAARTDGGSSLGPTSRRATRQTRSEAPADKRSSMLLRFWTSVAVCGWIASTAAAIATAASPQAAPATSTSTPPVDAVLKQYCVTCHNARLKTGELSLENVSAAD